MALIQQHLPAFLEAFLAKPYKKQWLRTVAQATQPEKLVRGMDALSHELDERYCTRLPKGSRQQDVSYVSQALARYKLTTGYVFSAANASQPQAMPLEEALQAVVGSSTTTILSFVAGKVAYFEGHSAGERYLCIKETT